MIVTRPDHLLHALCPTARMRAGAAEATSLARLMEHGAHLAETLRTQVDAPAGTALPIVEADPLRLMVAMLAAWCLDWVPVPLDADCGGVTQQAVQRLLSPPAWLAAKDLGPKLTFPTLALDMPSGGRPQSYQPTRGGSDPAIILMTSGSSALPKAVPLTHANLRASLQGIGAYLPVRAFPSTGIVLPLTYAYALIGQLLVTLAVEGGEVTVFAPQPFPHAALAAVHDAGVQGLSTVPAMWQRWSEAAVETGASLQKLAYAGSAGARMPQTLLPLWQQLCPQATLFNQYGCTEAGPRISAISSADAAFWQGAVGWPVAGLDVAILDGDGNSAPAGASGAVGICGPSVTPGYLGEAPTPRRNGYLLTGDLGWQDAGGCLYLEGRADRVVQVGGVRVAVDGTEAALRACPFVRDVAVVASAHPQLGHALVAHVVVAPGHEDNVRAHAARALPPAACPRQWKWAGALPRNARGKLTRLTDASSRRGD